MKAGRLTLVLHYTTALAAQLTLVEAMYMLARDEIAVVRTDRSPLTVATAWALFKEASVSASPRQFACNYAAYTKLREKGWVVKMGQTYGCMFTLYQGDPDFFHSQFCVLLRDVDAKERCTLRAWVLAWPVGNKRNPLTLSLSLSLGIFNQQQGTGLRRRVRCEWRARRPRRPCFATCT